MKISSLPLCLLLLLAAGSTAAGETLYNGIQLPAAWPPDHGELTREPMDVPYLRQPPAVIPIDVGRQLFVDDFLVEQTTLARVFHHPTPFAGNPVLKPDRPWEELNGWESAGPFSDGAWFDPRDQLFKLWYLVPPSAEAARAEAEKATKIAGTPPLYRTCLAYSRDGIHWEKPAFDVVPGTNVVLTAPRDSDTVWFNPDATDPRQRFALFRNHRAPKADAADGRTYAFAFTLHWSPDGIHWSEPAATSGGLSWIGDRHTAFYNPFRHVWVLSMRNSTRNDPALLGMRARLYHENADAEAALKSLVRHPWVGADRLDPHHPRFPAFEPQLYNLDAVAYESVMLGMFSILQGPENEDAKKLGIHKRNEILLGFSRDGYHWDRPDRTPFIGVDETDGAWNWGNVQSVGGGCLIVGDRLYFYASGRRWSSADKRGPITTGLFFLRRDGFASMEAGTQPGTLTTRPVQFSGRQLFVNADAAKGELRVEILDSDGNGIAPFSADRCIPIAADGTKQPVRWKGADDLASLAGRPVRFRFHLTNGSLFAFWVSPDASGASRGYVAAGGPGFAGSRDVPAEAK
jgi:hypothetical protein